jgi:urea transport system substrate-binding protein
MLVGSDYVFPRVANEIMLESLKQKAAEGVSVVGDPLYVPLERWSFDDVVAQIRRAPPDVILNTINGAANLEFFWNVWQLKREGSDSKLGALKVMSFSLGDHEVQRIGVEILKGHHAAWSYFASLDSQANDTFLRSMRATKQIFFPSDPAESAFVQVQAFAKAASALLEHGKRLEWQELRKAVLGVEIDAPSGRVTVDPATGHVSKTPRIGTVTEDGSFSVTWTSGHTVEPNPYPFPDLAKRIQSIRAQLHGFHVTAK